VWTRAGVICITLCASVESDLAVRTTRYFEHSRRKPDRASIELAWIEATLRAPCRVETQRDGRKRLWRRVPEAEGRWLRVVVLADGATVHDAFFDRRFAP